MKKIAILFTAVVAICASCGNTSDTTKASDDNTQNLSNNDSTKTVKDSLMTPTVTSNGKTEVLNIDTYTNDVARVIAGLPILGKDSILFAIQQTPYYATYKKFCDESFGSIKTKMLNPIQKWTTEKNIGDNRENSTCFYPFSGPDFMFANAFYPKAQNYILLGLERRGSTPSFAKMTETQRKNYFNGMIKSMKYINTRGYFVTQHMGSDYTKTHLNGVTHMVLYMMARTGHSIISVGDGWLDKAGKLTHINEQEKNPEGSVRMKVIEFTNGNNTERRTLYFFNHNIADEPVKSHSEMVTFIQGFSNKSAYLKAAQCAAFNSNFETARSLVLSCDKVIQDDSGIPYKHFADDSKYKTQLFGTYTGVISDLKWCFQPQLKKDLENLGENKDLPFKISYNGNYGKGVIIYAEKK